MPPTTALADHTYSYCLAVLGDSDAAAEAARLAIRRGGRSRWAVLAHARHEVLSRPDRAAPDPESPVPTDLAELARWLAATRPAEERATVDLADRHALDRGTLGRVRGESPAAAAARVLAIDEAWTRELDPALLASLGPAECDALAEVLEHHDLWIRPDSEEGEPAAVAQSFTFGRLVAAAPAVGVHAAECDTCSDRLRAMVSVRTVLGAVPIAEAPSDVRTTARSRRRRPFPVPPVASGAGRRRLALAGVAVAALAVSGVAGSAILRDGDDGDRVAEFTLVPARGSSLAVRPVVLRSSGSVVLENTSDRPVRWTATAKRFMTVSPATGELPAGESTRVQVGLAPTAPEGDLRATVTFGSSDGSSTAVRLETAVDKAPDLDARIDNCVVSASVEDETGVASVTLHRREGRSETALAMRETARGWTATLIAGPSDVRWWVSAIDTRGNQATTSIEVLTARSC